jgi:hypothetical protein
MGRSRKDIGRRTRLGWLLALFLLIVPAPVMAGVEWTLEAGDQQGPAADPAPGDGDSGERGDAEFQSVLDAVDVKIVDSEGRASDGSEWTGDPDGSVRTDQLEELRGVEWT